MRTQYLPNQMPRWLQIAYQSLDTEYTNLIYSAPSDRVYVSGTTLEQGTSFTISNTTVVKPATTSRAAFVACLTSGGAYVWHSWIVGSGDQIPAALALTSSDTRILVACTSTTTDTSFSVSDTSVGKPVTIGVSSVVLDLNTNDGTYNGSSWIDGGGDEYIRDLQVGSDGSIYYVGDSTTTGILIDIAGGTVAKPATTDAAGFWVKLTSAGAFVAVQWIYGSGNVFCRGLRINSAGDFLVCGDTIVTDTTFTVAGTVITKPATTFVSAFVVKLLAADGTYVWDQWMYTSLNMYGNTLCLDTNDDVMVGGRSNETGAAFYVSGTLVSKPPTNNYAGYIVRFATGGSYLSNTWIDGPDFDYVTEMVPSGDLLFVLGSSSTAVTEITVNSRSVTKPATLNSAGFVFALVKNSFDYLYGLWLDGTQNEYNRGLAVSGDRIFFTGISNSNETSLREGDEIVTKPATTAVFGYASMYQLDMNVLLRNPLMQFATVRKARMYNVVGRRGFTPSRRIPDGVIVLTNLVNYLDAGNATSYPGSGTTWFDLSTQTLNASIVGATYSADNGGCFVFNGTSAYVVTPRLPGTGTSSFSQSICVWVSPNDTDGNIVSVSDSNPQGGWNMPPIAADVSRFRGKYWSNNYMYSTTYTNSLWYYVCSIFDFTNSRQRLYVNGIMVGEQTGVSYSASGSNNFFFLGQQNPGADNMGMFAGRIAALHVYSNKALTDAEVLTNFNANRGRYGV